MKEPTLIIMAAGMGSRFGGLKQVAPVGIAGEPILDFSLFDARRAGFRHIVFIITEALRQPFTEMICAHLPEDMKVDLAIQSLEMLPEGFSVPEGRQKPWGTGHAVLCAAPYVDGSFMVINADDYYGPDCFRQLYRFLSEAEEREGAPLPFAMVAYYLKNTVTEHGHVSRGICTVEDGRLCTIVERTKVARRPDGSICYTEDDGASWHPVPEESLVSMNCWGFSHGLMDALARLFPATLSRIAAENPLKGEFHLPFAVNELLQAGKAEVRVLPSADRWYGVTYQEDLAAVQAAIAGLQESSLYPEKLW